MFRSIRIQATLLAFTLAIIPLVVVTYIISQRSFSSLEDEATVRQQQEAQIAAERISAFIDERENQLEYLSQVQGLSSLEPDAQRDLLDSLLAYEPTFRDVTLLDASGTEVLHLSRREVFLPEDLGSRADTIEFTAAMTGDIYVSEVQIDETIREPYVSVGYPIRDVRSRQITLVLVTELRFRPVWDLIAGIQSDDDSNVYVTDTEGLLVAHANPSIVLSGTTYELPSQDGRADGLFGDDVIQARTTLQFGNLELVVVSERLRDDALQLASDNVRTSAITTVIALALVALVTLLFVGRFLRPILNLSKVAQEISDGNLEAQAQVHGDNELSVLGRSFNAMTERLRSLIQNLETRVEERTAELRISKQETEAALEKALAADELKSQFLASMSHELRTPLNSILTFTELMSIGTFGDVTDEQVEYLGKSLSSGRHLLSLINDVLDITKIQSGMMKLFIEDDFDVVKEVEQVSATAKSLLNDKPVELVLDIDRNFEPVSCDKRRIRQVLLNLVSNAIKFTEEGTITLSAKNRHDEVLFAVIDTGPGISEEQLALVFEPFVQTETGIKHAGGTGLGLPISKQLVQSHGGSLTVESTVGEGSAFYFNLPIKAKTIPVLAEATA